MKKFLTFALAAALCAPAFAQRMGSSNSDAPAMKQSINAGAATMSLDYTAITWASGSTMSRILDKEKGANMRKRVNGSAAESSLGTFTTSVDCKVGETMLAAGEYKVYFTIGEDLAWSINFQGKDGKVNTVALKLADSGHESKRLMLCMYATDGGAGVYVAFGKQSGDLQIAAAAKTEGK